MSNDVFNGVFNDVSNDVFIKKFASWTSPDDPELEWCDPVFRRRLSRLSKLSCEVIHKLLPLKDDIKTYWTSVYGETGTQFKINKTLAQDSEIRPAQFSVSVFNAPCALSSIALNLKGGYTVIFCADFSNAFKCAVAPLFAGSEDEVLFVFADEFIPTEYNVKNESFAFACVLSLEGGAVKFSRENMRGLNPEKFLDIAGKEFYGSC